MLKQGNEVENAYSSLDSSSIAFARRNLPGITQAAKAPLALCNADAERICPGVAPGGGKIIACLKQHKDEVSFGCAKALKAMKTKRGT
jgi:cysteine rich repeat protein